MKMDRLFLHRKRPGRLKKLTALLLTAALCMALSACGENPSESGASTQEGTAKESGTQTDVTPAESDPQETSEDPGGQQDERPEAADAEDFRTDISGAFTVVSAGEKGFSADGNVYTFTKAGTYRLSGRLEEGQLVVDAGNNDKIELELDGVYLSNSTAAPILALKADKVKIKILSGSYSEIRDLRPLRTEYDEAGGGAVYAKCDLEIGGSGSLYVEAGYNNGIHTSGDLTLEKLVLKVKAVKNALKGNDSVTVVSGDYILIAENGDGIKTENSDISSKGKQRGKVCFTGGITEIHAACDGVDASHNVEFSGAASVSVYTADYSDLAGEGTAQKTGRDYYLIIAPEHYSSAARWGAYYYQDDPAQGVWAEAEYSVNVSSGRTSYYGLLLKEPAGYTNVEFYRFSGPVNSRTEYEYRSAAMTVSGVKNAFLVSSVENGTVFGTEVELSMGGGPGGPGGPGGQEKGKKTELDYSCKGIKCDNEIILYSGSVSVQSMDNGLHANADEALDTGAMGSGIIRIEGGELTVSSRSDGIKPDTEYIQNGGTVQVLTAVEGIESNLVTLNDGFLTIFSTDDGINACSGPKTPCVTVSGGVLEVSTPGGDTDAIDSNGSFVQTGGLVLVKGGSAAGAVSGSIDVDRTVKVTGGTTIALGGVCEVPSGSDNCNTIRMVRKSFPAGSYEIKDEAGKQIAAFTLEGSYAGAWISSDAFVKGGSYTLIKDGQTFAAWTQNSQMQNVS